MSLPPGAKLHKALLLLLCSDVPGEVIAARDALLRLAGVGPHELAAELTGATPPKPPPRSASMSETQKMALDCVEFGERGGTLSEKEMGFVRDMVSWRTPTEKQLAWLEKIHARTQAGR